MAHVFPGMTNPYFISVGQLCYKGYCITFRIDGVTIYNSAGNAILKGQRDLNTGLWRINLRHEKPQRTISVANKVYELRNTGALVNYLHKDIFSPTKSALQQAVKNGHLTTWPGLTEQAINKHLKMTPVTAMGHMHQRHRTFIPLLRTQSRLTWKMKQLHLQDWGAKLTWCIPWSLTKDTSTQI
jgi:hypothetical protein